MTKLNLIKLFCITLLLSSIGDRVHASAWLRSEAESYLTLRAEYSAANQQWDRSGNIVDLGCNLSGRLLSGYYEYGYSYYHTIFSQFSAESRSCGNDSASGIEDVVIGVRGRINPYRNGFAWEAKLFIPTGYTTTSPVSIGKGKPGLELGVARRDPLIVDKATDYETTVIEYGVAVRLWAGPPTEEFRSYVKLTNRLSPLWTLSFLLDGDFSINDADTSGSGVIPSEPVAGFKLFKGTLELSRRITPEWRAAVGYSVHISGERVTRERATYFTLSKLWR
jgi:hypothetical protein